MNITDIRKHAGALAYSLTLGILITLLIACEPPGPAPGPMPEPMQRTAGVTISETMLTVTEADGETRTASYNGAAEYCAHGQCHRHSHERATAR